MTHVKNGRPLGLRTMAGGVLAVVCHMFLLALVLGQVVYLASRNRTRWDLTSEKIWSLTESTQTLVDKLDKQLLVEAYFSPGEDLPVTMRQTRSVLDNFLDELVQLGNGRVVVQRFDPNSDKAISDRCTRLGVKPVDVRGSSATSISVDRHWQGLRIKYGGSKQKVLGQVAPSSSPQAELLITPAIKEVVTTEKYKFGFMEWPIQEAGQPQGIGWSKLRTVEDIARRFEFQNLKSEDAPLIPEEIETLFLFRPKELSDRQKYVIDQFVVRGGTLVVFADASEYRIGQQRAFSNVPVALDAATAETKFLDQLNSYGVDWQPKLLADMAPEAHRPRDILRQPFEYFAIQTATVFGNQARHVPYPYFFHAVATDWSKAADRFARNAEGEVDEAVAKRFRETHGSGIPSDAFMFTTFKNVGRGPGFYWPTWVGLRRKAGGVLDLPAGITGTVHLQTSPGVLVEDPPRMLNPVGFGDPRAQTQELRKFVAKLNERSQAEPRQQAPLMCEVRGKFASFFAGSERPKRPSEIAEAEARAAAAARAGDDTSDTGQGEGQENEEPVVGPPSPVTDAGGNEIPAAAPEAELVAQGERDGRIIMIGDSDFIRDDLVGGNYARLGGPYSTMGGAFFNNLLQWLAKDSDLVALQSRQLTTRTLQLVDDPAPGTDPRVVEEAVNAKTAALRGVNIVLPCLLLGAFGLMVFMIRRGQKKTFLESLS
ncbi:MAG: GldG family protein [bacterium]|nr:GldG family protein [bacterium]